MSSRTKRIINFPEDCECPEIVTRPCEFFACLNPSEVKFIIGFGGIIGRNEPCIGFVIDTTGSMVEEIAATKRVILTFMASQAEATECYILVPFNDYGDVINPINSKLAI